MKDEVSINIEEIAKLLNYYQISKQIKKSD